MKLTIDVETVKCIIKKHLEDKGYTVTDEGEFEFKFVGNDDVLAGLAFQATL
jgi:ribose 5-phosphate isomerase RpiB